MVTSLKIAAWIDTAASAVSLAMAVWLHHVSQVVATEAVARYGRNVDPGLYELAAANSYFFPAFVVLGFAAVAIFPGWAWRRPIHRLA